MRRTTRVKPHLREGKAVVGHERNIPFSTQGTAGAPTPPSASHLLDLSLSNEPVTTIVDRNGKLIRLNRGTISDADLSGYDLRNVNFYDLENVNLSGAILDGATLGEGDIKGCNFDGASMKGATIKIDSVEDSSFRGADFTGANLGRDYNRRMRHSKVPADFSNCDFSGATFNQAEIKNFIFDKVNFDNAVFEDATITEVEISGSMKEARFTSSNIIGGTWADCKTEGLLIEDCIIDEVMLLNAKGTENQKPEQKTKRKFFSRKKDVDTSEIKGITIKNSTWAGGKITFRDFSNSNFSNVKFNNVSIHSCKLSNAAYDNVSFLGCNMSSLEARGCDFSSTSFSGSTFGLNEHASNFSGNNFSGADFSDAILNNSNFKGSNWTGAKTSDMHIFKDAQEVNIVSGTDLPVRSQEKNSYEHYSFSDAAAKKGYSDKQFEFLVVTGAIEIRQNGSKLRQTKDFDPDKHHVPVWAFQNMPDLTNT